MWARRGAGLGLQPKALPWPVLDELFKAATKTERSSRRALLYQGLSPYCFRSLSREQAVAQRSWRWR